LQWLFSQFAYAPDCLLGDCSVRKQNAQLTISRISPTSGSTAGGTAVTVTGSGFEKGSTVSFGYVPAKVGYQQATSIEVVDETTISALTPGHARGTVDVIVTKRNGETAALVRAFEYK
jgi:hypothetical protein